MKVISIVSLLCLLLHCVTTSHLENHLTWNSLRATYGENKTANPLIFGSLPLTMKEANRSGFVRTNASWEHCKSEAGNFLGHRYMKSGDPAIILLFDEAGYIAGVQSSFPIEWIKLKGKMKWFTVNQMFVPDVVQGKNSYALTAYFIDPKRICDTGRTEAEFQHEKVGTGLYFQNGTDPIRDSAPEIPRSEKEMRWKLGFCVPLMGSHYWMENMNCSNIYPLCTLYDEGQLIGFGWTVQQSDFGSFSPRLETPPGSNISQAINPTPQCLIDMYAHGELMTVLHFYFVEDPWNITCPDQTK